LKSKAVRPGADRAEVARRVAGAAAAVRAEHVARDHHGAAERLGPERRRLLEHDPHRVVPELLDARQIAIETEAGRRGRWTRRVLPPEHHVVGNERPAVVPRHALLEPPGDRGAVPRHAAVVRRRRLRGEHGHEVALGVEVGERLVEDARGRDVLHADGQVRVQDRRRLPVEEPERAAAAAPRRRGAGRLGARRGGAEELRGERSGEPEAGRRGDEPPAAQPPGADRVDQRAERVLVHRASGRRLRGTAAAPGAVGVAGAARVALERAVTPRA
jgi:hypothetical protein